MRQYNFLSRAFLLIGKHCTSCWLHEEAVVESWEGEEGRAEKRREGRGVKGTKGWQEKRGREKGDDRKG